MFISLNKIQILTFLRGITKLLGHAIAQAVSRWLATTAARVWQLRFVVNKVVLGRAFSEYFSFPCQSSFHQILQHHNHPRHVQQAIQGPMCRVDPVPAPHYCKAVH
jgi:hypothetical protein